MMGTKATFETYRDDIMYRLGNHGAVAIRKGSWTEMESNCLSGPPASRR